MPRFRLARSGAEPLVLEAPNWVGALGLALQRDGGPTAADRLVVEAGAPGAWALLDLDAGLHWRLQDLDLLGAAADAPEPPSLTPMSALGSERSEDSAGALGDSSMGGASLGQVEGLDELGGLDDASEEAVDDPPSEDLGSIGLLADGADDDALQTVTSAPSAALAWAKALDAALQRVACEGGAAVALTPQGSLQFIDAAGAHGRQLQGIVLPPGTGLVGACIAERRTVVVADAARDPRFFGQIDAVTRFSTRSVLCAPVQTDDAVFGALELLNARDPAGFGPLAQRELERVAGALARRIARR